jgi:pimeloyl-ACP methyl ester carboxylesterase
VIGGRSSRSDFASLGIISHAEHFLEGPAIVRYYERLASFARLITFDKRGTGMSDREIGNQSLEDRMDDIRAVRDAVGSTESVTYGFSEGGSLELMFAATYPERTRALVLFGATPTYGEKFAAAWAKYADSSWGSGEIAAMAAASRAADPAYREWFGRLERLAATSAGRAGQKVREKCDECRPHEQLRGLQKAGTDCGAP